MWLVFNIYFETLCLLEKKTILLTSYNKTVFKALQHFYCYRWFPIYTGVMFRAPTCIHENVQNGKHPGKHSLLRRPAPVVSSWVGGEASSLRISCPPSLCVHDHAQIEYGELLVHLWEMGKGENVWFSGVNKSPGCSSILLPVHTEGTTPMRAFCFLPKLLAHQHFIDKTPCK